MLKGPVQNRHDLFPETNTIEIFLALFSSRSQWYVGSAPGVWSICQQVVEELRVLSFQLFSALLGLGQLKGFHQRLVHLHLKLLRVGSLRLLR